MTCTVERDGTFEMTKHDVPARPDDDALEYAFRTKLPPPLLLFAAAVLLTVGVLRLRDRHA